jgi:hypothetical protein
MKNRLMVAIAGVAILSSVFVGGAAAESSNTSQNACFGQGRAAGVHLISGKVWGDIASDRAGDNAPINAAYREACLAAQP